MWNSHRPNSNTLFALEQNLFGDISADETAEQFSVEESQEQEVEAQAFDWDEAIELNYQDNTDPDAMSMSWDDTEDTSESFDLDEEDTDTDNVEAFAIEEEEASQEEDEPLSHSNSLFALEQSLFRNLPANPSAQQFSVEEEDDEALSHSNSLFALEQSLFGTPPTNPPAEQFSIQEPETQGVQAQAFDWDETIELDYSEETYPTAMSLDWLPTDDGSESFGLGEEPLTYDVEAFEVDDEAVSEPQEEAYPSSEALEWNNYHPAPAAYDDSTAFEVNTDNATPEPTTEEDNDSAAFEFTHYNPTPTSQAYSAPKTVTVDATVVPPSPPPPSDQPEIDFDELERAPASSRASDAEAFAADLEAILRGEKTYEPPAETPTPAPAPPPQFPPAPQSQAQSVAPKPASPHDIFDQMGRNMAHATAFDLGTFSLEQRFDEFDEILDREEQNQYQTVEAQSSSSPDEEMQPDEEMGEAMDFDDTDLMDDLDQIERLPLQGNQLSVPFDHHPLSEQQGKTKGTGTNSKMDVDKQSKKRKRDENEDDTNQPPKKMQKSENEMEVDDGNEADALTFTFIDVGQGNGTLVEFPNGELMLVDCGCKSSGTVQTKDGEESVKVKNYLETQVKNFLDNKVNTSKFKKLSYVIISHPDSDHLNLLPTVLNDINVEQVIFGGKEEWYKKKQEVFNFFVEKKAKIFFINQGNPYSEAPNFGPDRRIIKNQDVSVWIVSANAQPTEGKNIENLFQELPKNNKPGTKTNTSSIVLCFQYGGNKVILTGDATFSTEWYILNQTYWKDGESLKSYALEGGHHGSEDSFSEAWLKKVNPQWIHFSADNKAQFKHPRGSVVQRVLRYTRVKESQDYGPHGIVVGIPDKQYDAVWKQGLEKHDLTQSFKELFDQNFVKNHDNPPQAAILTLLANVRQQGKQPEGEWFQPLSDLLNKYKQLQGQNLVDTLRSEPLVTYWTDQLSKLSKEIEALEKEKRTESPWPWLITDTNLFTSLVTANLGVYWELKLKKDGKVETELT